MPPDLQASLREIAGTCLARKLRQVTRAVSAIYDEALRPHGVKVSQVNVLVALGVLGQASPGELAERLTLERSTLSRNIERMRTRGWLDVATGADARSHSVSLTREGRRLLQGLLADWKRAQREARALLGARGAAAVDAMAAAVTGG